MALGISPVTFPPAVWAAEPREGLAGRGKPLFIAVRQHGTQLLEASFDAPEVRAQRFPVNGLHHEEILPLLHIVFR